MLYDISLDEERIERINFLREENGVSFLQSSNFRFEFWFLFRAIEFQVFQIRISFLSIEKSSYGSKNWFDRVIKFRGNIFTWLRG